MDNKNEWSIEEIPKATDVDSGVRILFQGELVLSLHFSSDAEPTIQVTSDNMDLCNPQINVFSFFQKHYTSLLFRFKEFTSAVLTH